MIPSSPCLRAFTLFLFCLLINNTIVAQEKTITAGFQFKPIFSSKFFNTGPESLVVNNVNFTIEPSGGYCFGMVIRRGFTNTLSFETGINYVKRNFSISIRDTAPEVNGNFSMVSYEIPVLGLVFIQLSDYIFMDVALGLSLDFYPSDLRSGNETYEHYSAKKSWFSPAVLANVGWEYRTESSGFFYLGASFHRPFSNIYSSFVGLPNLNPTNNSKTEPPLQLQGSYLTVDLRYFFHSDPLKRKKVKKNDPRTQ